MKRKFIAYKLPYGGQTLKVRNYDDLINTIDIFLNKLTDGKTPNTFELTLFESPSNQIEYDSEKLLVWAFERFGNSARQQWASGANDEYCYKWQLEYSNLKNAIEFLRIALKYHKYYIGPVQISISYDFKWKQIDDKIYQFQDEQYLPHKWHSSNHMLIFLSKQNSIIPDFYFPFEEPNDEFIKLKNLITEFLPTDLKMKNFRIWIPNKSNTGYMQRKIELLEQ